VTAAVGATVLGSAWVGFGLGFLLLIRAIPQHGRLAALTVLIAVFAADTAAYFVGMGIGRHKLAPRISPGKTWEGFVAGMVATVFVVFVALYQDRHTFLSIGHALVLGIVLALAGPAGDLFESSVKRDMRVKDSGRILAGHGGMLDRVDALLFASVAAFYVILAFGAP
jgi:phosphatidate cytidylyltransferase